MHTAGIRAAPIARLPKTPSGSPELCERLVAIPLLTRISPQPPHPTSTALKQKPAFHQNRTTTTVLSLVLSLEQNPAFHPKRAVRTHILRPDYERKQPRQTARPHPEISCRPQRHPAPLPAKTLPLFRTLCPAPQSSARTACPDATARAFSECCKRFTFIHPFDSAKPPLSCFNQSSPSKHSFTAPLVLKNVLHRLPPTAR